MSAPASQLIRKSEETRARILEAALARFRERGFAATTMREIAAGAGVATGAAYYYFASKDAIAMAFYERAQEEMAPALTRVLEQNRTLETRLRGMLVYKLDYFARDRGLLAALSAHMDPAHPLSPFGAETEPIRTRDLSFFTRAVEGSGVKLPRSLAPYLPRLLWLYQMGILLFWVYDGSPAQARTALLLDKTMKLVMLALRLGALPVLRSAHRVTADLLEALYGRP